MKIHLNKHKMTILIKSYLVLLAISTIGMVTIFKVTEYVDNKPKTNKFRQWWSRHIVDLDNNYE